MHQYKTFEYPTKAPQTAILIQLYDDGDASLLSLIQSLPPNRMPLSEAMGLAEGWLLREKGRNRYDEIVLIKPH